MTRLPVFLLTAMGMVGLIGQAQATPVNQPPPSGNVIYSLTGQTISSSYQTATISFMPSATTTNLSFAFREDPAFINLKNVSLVDTTTGSGNLLTNGDFSLGVLNAQPTGWSYLNVFGATYGGKVQTGSPCGPSSGNCYHDGAVQAYDGITQSILTTLGHTYALSFSYADTCAGSCSAGGVSTYQPLSTNGDTTGTGGNGRDMLVYAGALPVRSVPEPGSLPMLGAGLIGIGLLSFSARRRRA